MERPSGDEKYEIYKISIREKKYMKDRKRMLKIFIISTFDKKNKHK